MLLQLCFKSEDLGIQLVGIGFPNLATLESHLYHVNQPCEERARVIMLSPEIMGGTLSRKQAFDRDLVAADLELVEDVVADDTEFHRHHHPIRLVSKTDLVIDTVVGVSSRPSRLRLVLPDGHRRAF